MFRSSFRALGAFALVASFHVVPAGAADTLHVEHSMQFAASPARVWTVLGDFKGLPGWHPAVATTAIRGGAANRVGAVREITTKDGAKIIEELLAWDGAARSMRYRILDSPLPVADYVSTLSVEPAGKGSRVVWKSNFRRATHEAATGVDDAKAREIVSGIYLAGFDGLRGALGEGAGRR